MCKKWFLDFCSFKIVFKVICALLTLLLIYQELFTFVVEKPSTTSREEKDIDINDIPEVVICLEPGFDTKVLEKYGYNDVGVYYKGIVDGEFVGWNGNENKTKPSIDICIGRGTYCAEPAYQQHKIHHLSKIQNYRESAA